MQSEVKVIDKISGETLFSCPIEEMEKAYAAASEMEEMGLEVQIKAPHIHQTLANSLGASEQQHQEYEQSMQEELEDHDSSCCVSSESSAP